jgi:type VI secretion system secreted protein VgrG
MPRLMEITTPLGDDVLLFHAMHAHEELGRLSEFKLDLLCKEETVVEFDKILGQNVTVKLELPDEGTRYFNGYVTRIGQGRKHGRYNRFFATVRPWTWFMTRTSDCRIFQNMTVPDIIKKVLNDHPYANVKWELTGHHREWIYCVQYRETDFNFISRLMEHEGIYYYYRHQDGHHTMVLTDSVGKQTPTKGYEKIKYVEPTDFVRPEIEHIHYWDIAREVQPGKFVHTDYNMETPSVDLMTQKPAPTRNYTPSKHEVYDYPGFYAQKKDGEAYAGIRIDEFSSQYETATGQTNARGLAVGALFTLAGYPRDDQNHEHMVVSATYEMTFSDYESIPQQDAPDYHCSFTAIPTTYDFRPQRLTPKPFVQGPQTAVVVGPGGEEIHTDKYGRVKVQFFWDREGKKDDGSSCWVRVSQPWAGKQWGAIAIPRIGQEVIVDFLEGDPDQPIITGRVYNAEQMPPYALPANKTQTGILTRSSMGGSPANANEFRFEDKKGSEQVYLHAEKNQDIEVENDETHWVGHDRTKTIDHDETVHVKNNRTETVDVNETITVHGARTETVDGNETITIHSNRTETVDQNETITVSGSRNHTVSQSETKTVSLQRTHSVGINETISVGAAQEITIGALQAVTVGASQTIKVGANQTTEVGGNQSQDIKGKQQTKTGAALSTDVGADETRKVAGARTSTVGKDDSLTISKNLIVTAGDSVTIKTGKASLTMKKDGSITLKGKDILIDGSGAVNVKASKDIVMKGKKILQN